MRRLARSPCRTVRQGGLSIKPLFIHGPAPGYRMALCVVLSFVMMLSSRIAGDDWMASVRTQLSTLVSPIQWLVSMPGKGVSWASVSLSSQTSLIDQNRQLSDELLEKKVRLQRMQTLEAENAQLRDLLKARPRRDIDYMMAELVMLDNDPYRQQMIIDRGEGDGAYIGQPVIDASGVAGKVIEVSRFTSRVLLINDIQQAVPIQVVRNGLRFIVQGTGDPDGLQVLHVPNNADIRPGDLLVTSGLGGEFPAGYPVATISDVQNSTNGPFAQVDARSASHLERSRHFLMLFAHNLPDEALTQVRLSPAALSAVNMVLKQPGEVLHAR